MAEKSGLIYYLGDVADLLKFVFQNIVPLFKVLCVYNLIHNFIFSCAKNNMCLTVL